MTTTDNPCPAPSLADRLRAEGLQPLRAAVRAAGLVVGPRTCLRWTITGVRGVRLESIRVAGRRLTSAAAVARFIAGQAAAHDAPPAHRALPVADAERVLRAHGLGR